SFTRLDRDDLRSSAPAAAFDFLFVTGVPALHRRRPIDHALGARRTPSLAALSRASSIRLAVLPHRHNPSPCPQSAAASGSLQFWINILCSDAPGSQGLDGTYPHQLFAPERKVSFGRSVAALGMTRPQ